MEEGLTRVRPERVTDSYAIAVWESLVVWVVDGHTPLEELERLRALVRGWTEQRGKAKNVTLVVIHGSNTSMSGEERRSVARMIDETKGSRLASATVIKADGMIGALHRSILTGFSLVVPPPHPIKFFAEVPPAIRFLHPYVETLCGRVSTRSLEDLVGRLHAEVTARRGQPASSR